MIGLNNWKGCSQKEVLADFEYHGEFTGEIILADYDIDGYDGSAYVLFTRDGKLYEVSGGHCSCMGLEDQWDEEEVSPLEIVDRLNNSWQEHNLELRKVLMKLVADYYVMF